MNSDLKALEFEGIRRLLEKLTATPYGADAARALEPAPALADALRMQASVSAAREVLEAGAVPALGELPDMRAALRQAAREGAALNVHALHNLRLVMQAVEGLRDTVERWPALYPGPAAALNAPAPVAERLAQTLAAGAALRPEASETLAELHGEQARLCAEAGQIVERRMQAADVADAVKEPKVQWHNQRAVFALHNSAADRVKGVRRGTAMGGRDVLMEPMEAVAVNNRLETVNGQIGAEQQRLLREITGVVRAHLDALHQQIAALTWIDLALAAGQLSQHLNAHAPQLADEPLVALEQAYHPLLLLQYADGSGPQPVPLSVRLDDQNRVLVITGPNTGGKTVVIKTLGLLTVMAHCGLHIPAEGDCVIGNYRRVMVDVGDHQSLFHHLSTFAGHVEVLKRILAEADERTLVLLDELGTGTDPEEGAALAMSVMDELVERRVQGIVNTHLSPLKTYAAQRDHVRNASMLFDHEQLRPTYQLRIGEPGKSLGLLIAEKSGLPPELVQRARDHLARF
ncbi:DNA mismatch repair protein MutS [Ectothiorhodospiraceae bacterium 2226]|nr:DNA mismatch repair protein MutS [Ectothiorhodospiraceae bacterium 2226]